MKREPAHNPARRLVAWAAVLLLALAGGVGTAHAEGARAVKGPLPKPPEISRFDNGLTLITLPWSSPGIVAYYTLVRVGARDEVEKGHSGFAHLFEHMMFRGTKRFPKDVYEQRVQDLGAYNNAYTTQDFTLYKLTGPEAALGELV